MLRKLGVLVGLAAFAIFASSAFAATATYQFKDGNGNVLPAGKFGENIQLQNPAGQQIGLTVTIPGVGTFTNSCDGYISGQISQNSLSQTLKALAPGHTFSNCSLSEVFAAGIWSLTVNQNQSGANPAPSRNGRTNAIDVLVNLAGGVCEFRGGVGTKINNVSGTGPSTLVLSGSLSVFTGPGTMTSGCPVTSGTVSGTVEPVATSNPTNNVTVG